MTTTAEELLLQNYGILKKIKQQQQKVERSVVPGRADPFRGAPKKDLYAEAQAAAKAKAVKEQDILKKAKMLLEKQKAAEKASAAPVARRLPASVQRHLQSKSTGAQAFKGSARSIATSVRDAKFVQLEEREPQLFGKAAAPPHRPPLRRVGLKRPNASVDDSVVPRKHFRETGQGVNDSDDCTLFVGDLPIGFDRKELEQLFTSFGVVTEARVIGSQCYGFVTFQTRDVAAETLQKVEDEPLVIMGNVLRVNSAQGSLPQWKHGPAHVRPRREREGPAGLEGYEHPKAKEARMAVKKAVVQNLEADVEPRQSERDFVVYDDL